MDSINADMNYPKSFFDSIRNEPFEIPEMGTTLKQKISSNLRLVLANQFELVWICIDNPRNEIDNPLVYCLQPFYTQISTMAISNVPVNISKDYQISSGYSITHPFLWNAVIALEGRFEERIQSHHNNPKQFWNWFSHGKIPMAEYYVLAYIIGSMSAEKAIELSGMDYMDFACLVQEKAMERDLPLFDAYLKDENVKDQLPFSEEKSREFRDLMSKEIE